MPIRINLLAEEQAAEELRRRDPVKRAVLIGIVLVGLLLIWSSSLQYSILRSKQQLSNLHATINSQTNLYRGVLNKETELQELQQKLTALNRLATNRFLWGTVLNALQQTTVDDVQLLEFRGEQSYTLAEETKPTTNDNKVIPGRPATATERIVLTLRAKDTGPGEGDNILKYMEALTQFPYFQQLVGKTEKIQLVSREPPQNDPDSGRMAVKFTLECRLPERTR